MKGRVWGEVREKTFFGKRMVCLVDAGPESHGNQTAGIYLKGLSSTDPSRIFRKLLVAWPLLHHAVCSMSDVQRIGSKKKRFGAVHTPLPDCPR